MRPYMLSLVLIPVSLVAILGIILLHRSSPAALPTATIVALKPPAIAIPQSTAVMRNPHAIVLPASYRPSTANKVGKVRRRVTVIGIARNNSSVKVFYGAVPGARDYRIYDEANPALVKYAGLVHLVAPTGKHFVTGGTRHTVLFPYRVSTRGTGPQVYDGPADNIEWNRIEDGKRHILVVQAVDQLGPVPAGNLYDPSTNLALIAPASSAKAHIMRMVGMPVSGMPMLGLGMNSGRTFDGLLSTNGQGLYTNNPRVIAVSLPFIAQADTGRVPIPSEAGASQTYLDTFANSEGTSLTQTARNDQQQTMTYRLNNGTPQAATLNYQFADTKDSFPFIAEGHFMDVLFDGGTPGTNNPLHQGHSSLVFTPDRTLSMGTSGGMIHLTMEVDGHLAGRRWVAFALAPASSPLTNPVWEIPQAISTTDQALVVQLFPASCTLNVFTGPTSSTNPQATGTAGGTYGSALWGAAGQASQDCQDVSLPENFNQNGNPNGRELDNRNRYDFFLSQTHAALFIDGHLLKQSDIPAGSFPWATQPLQASFIHYVYHTALDIQDNQTTACYPENAYWFNDPIAGTTATQDTCSTAYPTGYGFQHSDERHWDNMGAEVMPAPASSTDFSSLASLVSLPRLHRPVQPPSGR